MATAERVFWETVAILVGLVLLIAILFWSGRRVDSRADSLTQEHAEELAEEKAEQTEELAEARSAYEAWSAVQAEAQAKAAFRSFAAGVHTAAVSGWGNFLATSTSKLANDPKITFVHVFSSSGRLVASSDTSVMASGRFDDESGPEWVLETNTLEARAGDTPAAFEMAGPVRDGQRAAAYLWIGYDVEAAHEEDRPAGLRPN